MTERDQIIADLKRIYGVETKQDVLRRALELALRASKYADGGGGGRPLDCPMIDGYPCHDHAIAGRTAT